LHFYRKRCTKKETFHYLCTLNTKPNNEKQMKNLQILLAVMALSCVVASCGKKKQSQDIIAPKVVKVEPKEPIRMQEYQDERDVEWIGKTYHVSVSRQPSDSLPMVQDENGQKFVDNVFTMVVSRSDGSVFFRRKFTKSQVMQYLDDNYRKAGVFEGLVFDRTDGDWLLFGASVGLPQTDEYIPLVVKLSRMGQLQILRDTEMDTPPEDKRQKQDDEDGV